LKAISIQLAIKIFTSCTAYYDSDLFKLAYTVIVADARLEFNGCVVCIESHFVEATVVIIV